MKNVAGETFLTLDTCTDIAAPASDATAVVFYIKTYVFSGNAIGTRFTTVYGYRSASCANLHSGVEHEMREQVAVTAGTELGQQTSGFTIPLAAVGGSSSLLFSDDAANTGLAIYLIAGYYD